MSLEGRWRWTPQKIIAAFHVFEEEYGWRPRYSDFNPNRNRDPAEYERFHDDKCWPTGATVIRHFGTWNAAVEAAGYEPIEAGTQPNPAQYHDTCVNGHKYTKTNTAYRKDNGTRICRTCARNSRRAAYNRHHKGPGSRASRGMPQSDHPNSGFNPDNRKGSLTNAETFDLAARGEPIQSIANAEGVTYQAITRRIDSERKKRAKEAATLPE